MSQESKINCYTVFYFLYFFHKMTVEFESKSNLNTAYEFAEFVGGRELIFIHYNNGAIARY